MRPISLPLLVVVAASTPSLAQEVIGPWTVVVAPASASRVAGAPNPNEAWLNVENIPIGINQAFSGFGIIDDGWANFSVGTVIEMSFGESGLLNLPGPDLVLFEGRFGGGSYLVYSSYDAFATSVNVSSTDFSDSGVNRDYFWDGAGPFSEEIWGAEIDLSDLAVPDGVFVVAVRVEMDSDQNDPIGVGGLNDPITIFVDGFESGDLSVWSAEAGVCDPQPFTAGSLLAAGSSLNLFGLGQGAWVAHAADHGPPGEIFYLEGYPDLNNSNPIVFTEFKNWYSECDACVFFGTSCPVYEFQMGLSQPDVPPLSCNRLFMLQRGEVFFSALDTTPAAGNITGTIDPVSGESAVRFVEVHIQGDPSTPTGYGQLMEGGGCLEIPSIAFDGSW